MRYFFVSLALVFSLAIATAFAGDARFKGCELLLSAPGLSPNAKNPLQHKLAEAYRDYYSALSEGLGVALQALHLEHIPASHTLSKSAKKRVRRAPQPILESIRLIDSASVERPYLGEIHYRVDRSEEGAVLKVERIGIDSNFAEQHSALAIERAVLARALFENADARRISLRVSSESIQQIERALDVLDPALALTPDFASKLGAAQKTSRVVQVSARLKELLGSSEGKQVARAAIAKTDEAQLLRDLGFETLLQIGSGPEIQTIELVMGLSNYGKPLIAGAGAGN